MDFAGYFIRIYFFVSIVVSVLVVLWMIMILSPRHNPLEFISENGGGPGVRLSRRIDDPKMEVR